MTIIEDAEPVNLVSSPPAGGQRTAQVQCDATGEMPLWVTYDAEQYAAIAFVTASTNRVRYLLGCAGYRHIETSADGELWALPTNTNSSNSKARRR